MGIFHRYNSTIHGNYRRAYIKCGPLVGLLLAACVLVRMLMRNPASSPTSYVSDAVMIVAVFLLTAYYRRSLPDGRITLKEAMLFGTGTALVGALVYGMLLWVVGLLSPEQTALFTTTLTGNETLADDPQIHYWAAWWAIYAALLMALIGSFAAFLAAIFLKTEKAETKHRKQ